MKPVTFILVLCLMAFTATAQNSPATGAVEGSIFQAGSTIPVARARVIVTAASQTRTTLADDSGRFSVRDIPPGTYQLLATRDSYVRARIPITIEAGQVLRDIALSIVPTGAITGRIVNARGEPFANVEVRALRYMNEPGKPVLTAVEVVRTNDLGEFRLYYLEPGTYQVSAIPPLGPRTQASEPGGRFLGAEVEMLPGNPAGHAAATIGRTGISTAAPQLTRMGFLSTADTKETYSTTFFPGTTDPSAAATIRVEPGSTTPSVDFILSPVPALTIRGQVLNGSTGQPQGSAAILLLSPGNGSDGISIDHYGSISTTGAFEFRGIAPGTYDVVASVGRLPNGIPPLPRDFIGGAVINRNPLRLTTPTNVMRMAGRTSIRVGNTDLDRITVALSAGFTVNGRIVIEGRSSADSSTMTSGVFIQLQPDPPDVVPSAIPNQRVQTGSLPATVGAGGAFSVTGVFAGTYQIGILNAVRLPENSYVKSARFGSADALNPRLRIGDSPQGTLEIVIGTNPGGLEATVVNEKQMAAAAVTVLLVPDPEHAQHYDRYRTAVAGNTGSARITSVVPGSYIAYALEGDRMGEWWDPEFAGRNAGLGRSVVIKEGEVLSVDLKSIPAEAGR